MESNNNEYNVFNAKFARYRKDDGADVPPKAAKKRGRPFGSKSNVKYRSGSCRLPEQYYDKIKEVRDKKLLKSNNDVIINALRLYFEVNGI